MTWTYSGDPASSTKDLVRFLVGDTVGIPTSVQLYSDEEINYVLTQIPSAPNYAAAALLDTLATKCSMQVTKSIGQTSIRLGERAAQLWLAASKLREAGPGNLPGGDGTGERSADMYVGGLSVTDNDALYQDESNTQPEVRIGQDDIPGVPQGQFGNTKFDYLP